MSEVLIDIVLTISFGILNSSIQLRKKHILNKIPQRPFQMNKTQSFINLEQLQKILIKLLGLQTLLVMTLNNEDKPQSSIQLIF